MMMSKEDEDAERCRRSAAASAVFANTSTSSSTDVRNSIGINLSSPMSSSSMSDRQNNNNGNMVVVVGGHSGDSGHLTNAQLMTVGHGKLMPQLTAESIGHDLSLNLNSDLEAQYNNNNNEKIEIDVDPNQHGYCNEDEDVVDQKLHSITSEISRTLQLEVINQDLVNEDVDDDDEHRPLKKRRLSRRKVSKSNSNQVYTGLASTSGRGGGGGGGGGGGAGSKAKNQPNQQQQQLQANQEIGRLKRNNVKLLKYQTILKNLVDILSQMNTCLGDKLYNVVTGKSVQNIPIYKLLEYIQPFLPMVEQGKEDGFLSSFVLLFEQYRATMGEKNKAEETLPQDHVYNYYNNSSGNKTGSNCLVTNTNDELNIVNSFGDYGEEQDDGGQDPGIGDVDDDDDDEDDGVMLEEDELIDEDEEEEAVDDDDDDDEWEAQDTSYSPKGKKATPKGKAKSGTGPGRKPRAKAKAGTSASTSAEVDGSTKKRRPRVSRKKVKNENGEPDNRNVSLFCPWPNCTYETKREWALNEHINLTHTGLKQFSCKVDDCQLNFYTSAELDLHMKKVHSDIASKEFMSCTWPGCNALFKSKLGLRGHLRIHKGEDMIACDWPGCNYTAKNKRQSENHQRKHTGDRPFSCGYEGCDASFRTNDSLRHHRKCHSEYRPFWCDWPGCDANFKTNRGLTLHRALHTGEKLFKCDRPDCDFASERKYHVDLHIYESHTHIKPYQCNWTGCDASFLRNDKLQNHLKIHRQEKPFKCIDPGCDKHFVEKGNMMKHFNNVHKRT